MMDRMRHGSRHSAGYSRIAVYAIPALCLLLLGAVWRVTRGPPGAGEQPARLELWCGAAMRPPVEKAVAAFQRRYGVRVEVQYGASNLLLGQLELTGRGDVFLPGDAFYVEEAARRGLVREVHPVALFVPVIQVAKGNPKGIVALEDLAAPGLRLALADERAAAIGRLTPLLFRDHGVPWEAIESNAVFRAVTAPELGQAVTLGHVDAALLWRPVVRQYPLTEEIEIPPERNRVSPIEAAVLASSRHPEEAGALARFLAGPAGRAIFTSHHYDPVDSLKTSVSGNRGTGEGAGH